MRLVLAIALCLGVWITGPTNLRADECSRVFSVRGETAVQPRLIILSAPSGGGKTTLAHLLIEDFPNLSLSVSSTTRAPRGQEKDGTDYHFLSQEDFKEKIAQGRFAEWAEVHGNFYGTDIGNIQNEFTLGHSVLALVDINGADHLRKAFPDQIFTIFITPPDMATLESRLRGRGTDTDEAIRLRLENAKKEMAEAHRFDAVVVNDDLDRAHGNLSKLLRERGLVPIR